MMTGTISPQKAEPKDFARAPQPARSREATMPFLRTSMMTITIRARPIMMPGTIPDMNISPTETPVMEA